MNLEQTEEHLVYLVEPADPSGSVHTRSRFVYVIENHDDLPPVSGPWPDHEGPKYLNKKGAGWAVRVMNADTGEFIP